MKSFLIICLFFIVLFSACDKCSETDCPPKPNVFYLSILPLDSNNQSPYFEPNKFLEFDSLKLISLSNNLEINPTYTDSSFSFFIPLNTDSFIIKYSYSQSEIVKINKKETFSDCCGSNFDGVSYIFNDTTVICGECLNIVRKIN